MKVLHITTSSRGGAGIAALRLHNALSNNAVESAFMSINLTIDFNNKVIEDSFFLYKKPTFFGKLKMKFKNIFATSERQKLENEFKDLEPKMQFEIATLPFSNYLIHKHPLYKAADIINLHWIDGIVDYQSFFSNNEKPIVWTFHDMNPFLGIFHYNNDVVLNYKISNSFDLKIKKSKANAIKNIKNGAIITPSNWLLNIANKSNIFSDFYIKEIPNSIDFDVFKIHDTAVLRKQFAISESEFVILFVSDSLKNPRKGFDLLLDALKFLGNEKISILTIGKGKVPVVDNLNIISLGEINSSYKMAECYAVADVFVLPSREDNLPNVMLESFACGTPLVGFNVGGIAEHTIPNLTGFLADEFSGASLADAIIKIKVNKENYKRETIRKYAKDNFNFKKQADSYLEIYDLILKKSQK